MNNVIGPISKLHWYTLRELRASVKASKDIDPIKYKKLIDIHSKLYKEQLKDIFSD